MVIPCQLLFVTTTVEAPLVAFIVTDPKLTAAGVTSTPASAETGNKTVPIKNIPINRHTKRVLSM
jgi:hypothetical protein